MTRATNNLARKLHSGEMAIMAECLPPRSTGAEPIREISALLPRTLDAVVVSDAPGEVHGSPMACARLLAEEGHATVLTIPTRDRNRMALECDALGAAALGIDAILSLSGDHQSLGRFPEAAAAYDIDSIQFTQAVKKLMHEAECPTSKMLVGAVAHPYLRPIELNLMRLKKKIAAGADFLVTQAIFDMEAFSQWLTLVRDAGLDETAAIIASVLPLTSAEQARRLQLRGTYGPIGEETVARAKEGVAIAADIAGQLKEMPGIRGIHILSGGNETLVTEVMLRAGL